MSRNAGWSKRQSYLPEQCLLDHFESCLEQEDDTRQEEAARQKEFLEKVVISQKGQLRQLEKVRKISDCGNEAS